MWTFGLGLHMQSYTHTHTHTERERERVLEKIKTPWANHKEVLSEA